jgi:hypothetical protein
LTCSGHKGKVGVVNQVPPGGALDQLGQDIQATADETRRHFDVVAEGLRSEIQLMTEGLGLLDQKVEHLRDEVREGFDRVDRRFLHLQAQISALERR